MAKDKSKPKAKKAAKATKAADRAAGAQHPAEGELSFQHVIRNMVVAREEARRKHEQA
jgi:hypothetical protein